MRSKQRETREFLELPVTEVHAGDMLLDCDYNPVGPVSGVFIMAGSDDTALLVSHNLIRLSQDCYVAVIRTEVTL